MKKIILIIEDRTEQQATAKKAVIDSGNTPIVAGNLADGIRLFEQLKGKLFGVITDLHYQSRVENNTDAEKPNGLAMVALCVDAGIRVGVCSDVNHHFSEYLKIPVKVFEGHKNYPFGKIPFSEDSKNWESIVHQLLNL